MTSTATIIAVVLATIVAAPATNAQPPHGKQDVKVVPGIDVSLKAGWQLLFHERCRFAVPGSWRADPDAALAFAPDGSSISIRMFRIANWSAHKGQIKSAFGHVNRVHEDSDHRLWFEIGDKLRAQHYIDVADGLNVCSGILEIRPATTPDEGRHHEKNRREHRASAGDMAAGIFEVRGA
jgi:hypothetical protein